MSCKTDLCVIYVVQTTYNLPCSVFFFHISDEKQGNFTADARKEKNASFGLQEWNVKGRLVDVDDDIDHDDDEDDHLRRGEKGGRSEGWREGRNRGNQLTDREKYKMFLPRWLQIKNNWSARGMLFTYAILSTVTYKLVGLNLNIFRLFYYTECFIPTRDLQQQQQHQLKKVFEQPDEDFSSCSAAHFFRGYNNPEKRF